MRSKYPVLRPKGGLAIPVMTLLFTGVVAGACAVGSDVPGERDAQQGSTDGREAADAGQDGGRADARANDAPISDAPLPDGRVTDAAFADAVFADAAPVDAHQMDAPFPDARLPDATLPDAVPADAHPFLGVCQEAALLPKNDTCDTAIDLTTDAQKPNGVTTYGDTRMYYQNDLEPVTSCAGPFIHDGFDAIYTVLLMTGETLTVTVTPLDFDVSVYLLEACSSSATCAKGRDAAFYGEPETLAFTALAEKTYFLVVDSFSDTESGCYTLHASIE